MARLQGKVALITGGARGLGAELSRLFLAEGAQVMVTDILEGEGKKLVSELGCKAKFVKQDVTKEEDWRAAVTATEAAFGPIDILINNAGVVLYESIENMPLDDYLWVVNVNQVSIFLGMKCVLPSMKKTQGGSIVNISSITGFRGGPGGAAYSSSKFAVRGLTQSAALEFAPLNIRVNSIHPGAIDTPMLVQEDTKDAVAEFAKTIPLRRIAQPREIAQLALFLASDEGSYCTGSEFVIDGGSLLK